MSQSPILVTGAAGRLGGVGGEVVAILRSKGLPVRALVRTDDDRAEALRATGVEVVVGDLTRAQDVARALDGCRRMYFGMSVSAPYLEATVTAAAVARELGGLEVFVNISQLTVSQMSLLAMTDSLQQRLHWLGEQALNWSGLPVVHVRATVFLQHFFFSQWAAESIAAVLEHPEAHVGRVIELTGPKSEDMRAVAAEYSEALGRTITYVDVPMAEWRERELAARGLPEHVASHFKTMAQLHADNRYDRLTHDFEAIIGRPATSIREYVTKHPELFGASERVHVSP